MPGGQSEILLNEYEKVGFLISNSPPWNPWTDPWVIGISGSLAAAGIAWLCKRLFGKNRRSQNEGVKQNASPVITQTFQPTINIPIDIHPPVAPQKDALGHLHKLRTESEFKAVQELWKRIMALKDAFWAIPKAGGVIGRRPDARDSAAFIKQHDDTARFLNDEILCIPKDIADEVSALLKITFDEALKAAQYPDPFNGSVSALLGERGWHDLVESRSKHLRDFNLGVEKLQNTMRSFLGEKNS